MLDAGCGGGGAVAELRAQGFDACGMDIADGALDHARAAVPGASFREHSVEQLPWPWPAGSLDAVVAFEVIEHLLEPTRLVDGAREVLHTGGHLALTTPYHGRLKNAVIAATAFDRHFDVTGDHVRFFTDGALTRLLEERGFSVARVAHYGRVPLLWKGVFVWARKR